MTTGILEHRTEEQRPMAPEPSSHATAMPPTPAGRRGLIVLAAVVALLGVYSVWGVQSSRSTLGSQATAIGDLSGKLTALEADSSTLRSQVADHKGELEEVAKRLAATDDTADRARTLAQRNRSEAQRSAQQLGGAIEEQRTELGSLGGVVAGVRTDVVANRKDIERALGGLTQQDSLIARNRDELDALKRSGSRDYFEFDLRKSKAFTRVGPLSVRLNKTDDKRQRYTVTLVLNDQQVEKKDNALFEPVQFYIPGTRSVTELVAQEIQDGRIVGYVSNPKETTPRS